MRKKSEKSYSKNYLNSDIFQNYQNFCLNKLVKMIEILQNNFS